MDNVYICPHCGYEDTVARKVIFSSNWHYNQGLSKAKVRDLSGAVSSLTQALKYNKRNMDARNLLGLIYYHIGEIVPALSQWVISVHFQPNSNPAAGYIKAIQDDPQALRDADRLIKQYNKSLEEIEEGNVDFAINRLKKVVNMNPNYVKAYQLLALLYMEREQYNAAHKVIMRAIRVDRNNITSLNYLNEINRKRGKTPITTEDSDFRIADPNPIVIQGGRKEDYKENSSGFASYINIIIGIVIGAAALLLLVVPTITRSQTEKYNQQIVEYSAQISERNSQIDDLNTQVDDLTSQLQQYTSSDTSQSSSDDSASRDQLMSALKSYLAGDYYDAGIALAEVDPDSLTNEDDQDIYEIIRSATEDYVTDSLFNTGYSYYDSGDYSNAVDAFIKALRISPTSTGSMYYLARSYQKLGDTTNAATYFNMIINNYPDSQYYSDAQTYLSQVQQSGSSSDSSDTTESESTQETSESTDSSSSDSSDTGSSSSYSSDSTNQDGSTYNGNSSGSYSGE